MPDHAYDVRRHFERGVVILSIDTEQMWGYLDLMTEDQFDARYPGAIAAHERLLGCLRAAGIGATWFVVGGMTLHGSEGVRDRRMAGLPLAWTSHIAHGNEITAPFWYRRAFIEHLRDAGPRQEIGLHGGLTHLIWTHAHSHEEVVEWELAEGVRALEQAGVHPHSFSFGRDREAFHHLLPSYGIRSFRGGTPVLAQRLGATLPGAVLRMFDEMVRSAPPPVWPREAQPGLWEIPSSLYLYPIGAARTALAPLPSRVERFRKGIEAAARCHGIFHYCLHPENLTESPQGFALFEEMLERLLEARDRGDVEIATVGEIAARMECAQERSFEPAALAQIPQARAEDAAP